MQIPFHQLKAPGGQRPAQRGQPPVASPRSRWSDWSECSDRCLQTRHRLNCDDLLLAQQKQQQAPSSPPRRRRSEHQDGEPLGEELLPDDQSDRADYDYEGDPLDDESDSCAKLLDTSKTFEQRPCQSSLNSPLPSSKCRPTTSSTATATTESTERLGKRLLATGNVQRPAKPKDDHHGPTSIAKVPAQQPPADDKLHWTNRPQLLAQWPSINHQLGPWILPIATLLLLLVALLLAAIVGRKLLGSRSKSSYRWMLANDRQSLKSHHRLAAGKLRSRGSSHSSGLSGYLVAGSRDPLDAYKQQHYILPPHASLQQQQLAANQRSLGYNQRLLLAPAPMASDSPVAKAALGHRFLVAAVDGQHQLLADPMGGHFNTDQQSMASYDLVQGDQQQQQHYATLGHRARLNNNTLNGSLECLANEPRRRNSLELELGACAPLRSLSGSSLSSVGGQSTTAQMLSNAGSSFEQSAGELNGSEPSRLGSVAQADRQQQRGSSICSTPGGSARPALRMASSATRHKQQIPAAQTQPNSPQFPLPSARLRRASHHNGAKIQSTDHASGARRPTDLLDWQREISGRRPKANNNSSSSSNNIMDASHNAIEPPTTRANNDDGRQFRCDSENYYEEIEQMDNKSTIGSRSNSNTMIKHDGHHRNV